MSSAQPVPAQGGVSLQQPDFAEGPPPPDLLYFGELDDQEPVGFIEAMQPIASWMEGRPSEALKVTLAKSWATYGVAKQHLQNVADANAKDMPESSLTADGVACLWLYCNPSFYGELRASFQSQEKQRMDPFRQFLLLLRSSLRQLSPSDEIMVYQSVKTVFAAYLAPAKMPQTDGQDSDSFLPCSADAMDRILKLSRRGDATSTDQSGDQEQARYFDSLEDLDKCRAYTASLRMLRLKTAAAITAMHDLRDLAVAVHSAKKDVTKLFVDTDAATTVVEAMESHPMDPGVQTAGCEIFWRLETKGRKDNIPSPLDAKIARVVLAAMMFHVEDAGIQEASCYTLRNLSRGVLENKEFVLYAENNAFPAAIVSAMQKHITHTGFQQAACQSLNNLSMCKENKPKAILLGAGAAAALVGMMRANKGHTGLQRFSCVALCNVATFATEDQKNLMINQGVLDAVLASIQADPDEKGFVPPGFATPEGLMTDALQALTELARLSEECSSKVLQHGDFHFICKKAMDDYTSSRGVQTAFFRLISILAIGTEDQKAAILHGDPRVVQRLITAIHSDAQHAMVLTLQNANCHALANLAHGNQENSKNLLEENTDGAVIEVMKRTFRDKEHETKQGDVRELRGGAIRCLASLGKGLLSKLQSEPETKPQPGPQGESKTWAERTFDAFDAVAGMLQRDAESTEPLLPGRDRMHGLSLVLEVLESTHSNRGWEKYCDIEEKVLDRASELAKTWLLLGSKHGETFAVSANILSYVSEEKVEKANEEILATEKEKASNAETGTLLFAGGMRQGPPENAAKLTPAQEEQARIRQQLEAVASSQRMTCTCTCSKISAREGWVPSRATWQAMVNQICIIKEFVLPLADVFFDGLNVASFFWERQYKWMAVLLSSMIFHSIAAAWKEDGEAWLAALDLLTFGTASQIVHAARSVRRGVRVPEVLAHRRFEAVESLVSLLITAHAVAAAGYLDGVPPLDGATSYSVMTILTGPAARKWGAIAISFLTLSLLAADDLDKEAMCTSMRYSHLRQDLVGWHRRFERTLFHFSGMASMMILLPVITVLSPYGPSVVFGSILLLALALHARSVLFGIDGDWVVVHDTGNHDLDEVFSFTENMLVTSRGLEFEVEYTSTSTQCAEVTVITPEGAASSGLSEVARAQANEAGASPQQTTTKFRVDVSRWSDTMSWGAGSYKEDKLNYKWRARELCRVETKRRGDSVGDKARCGTFCRWLRSFLHLPLLLVVAPAGYAHPWMLWQVAWLRPLFCLCMWSILWVRANEDALAAEMLEHPHVLALLVIAGVGLLLYGPLAYLQYRKGRWEHSASWRKRKDLRMDGSFLCCCCRERGDGSYRALDSEVAQE